MSIVSSITTKTSYTIKVDSIITMITEKYYDISIRGISYQSGMSKTSVEKIMIYNQCNISLDNYIKLCLWLNVSLDEFIVREYQCLKKKTYKNPTLKNMKRKKYVCIGFVNDKPYKYSHVTHVLKMHEWFKSKFRNTYTAMNVYDKETRQFIKQYKFQDIPPQFP